MEPEGPQGIWILTRFALKGIAHSLAVTLTEDQSTL
jgi:hypothetical protein